MAEPGTLDGGKWLTPPTHARRITPRTSGQLWQGRFKALPVQGDETIWFTVLRLSSAMRCEPSWWFTPRMGGRAYPVGSAAIRCCARAKCRSRWRWAWERVNEPLTAGDLNVGTPVAGQTVCGEAMEPRDGDPAWGGVVLASPGDETAS